MVAVGDKMGLETFALINSLGQVINHVVIDKEADNFEQVMADQLEFWACTRYVETTDENPIIVLNDDPEIWTTHCDDPNCEQTGFTVPALPVTVEEIEPTHTPVVINGRTYPSDSLLIKDNAHLRPEGWELPEGEVEVELP
jgi:hypothetical protein